METLKNEMEMALIANFRLAIGDNTYFNISHPCRTHIRILTAANIVSSINDNVHDKITIGIKYGKY